MFFLSGLENLRKTTKFVTQVSTEDVRFAARFLIKIHAQVL